MPTLQITNYKLQKLTTQDKIDSMTVRQYDIKDDKITNNTIITLVTPLYNTANYRFINKTNKLIKFKFKTKKEKNKLKLRIICKKKK